MRDLFLLEAGGRRLSDRSTLKCPLTHGYARVRAGWPGIAASSWCTVVTNHVASSTTVRATKGKHGRADDGQGDDAGPSPAEPQPRPGPGERKRDDDSECGVFR